MSLFSIRSFQDNKVLFSGHYASFRAALEEAVTQNVDLSCADLRRCNLRDTNLDDGKFKGADFTGANLSGANISEAELSGANFTAATLHNACLAYATMCNVTFSYALFGATDITGADLSGSVFEGQSCFSLDFMLADNLGGCVYYDENRVSHSLARPPVVIKGLKPQPIVLFQDLAMVVQIDAGKHVQI